MNRSVRRRHAFTLVELLVVIGIIAVLVAILLPALNKARKQANTIKCAASLKEIGHCIEMYVNDNRGWMLPARAGEANGGSKSYLLAETEQYYAADPALSGTAWWYMFISKYVTKNKGGVDGSAGSPNDKSFMNTIIWGCPEYRPHQNNQATPDEFTRVYTGYGFNAWPTFTADNPSATATNKKKPSPLNGRDAESVVRTPNGDWSNLFVGNWFKFTQYTHPSQRAMVGDSDWWELESLVVATDPPAPQRAWTSSNSEDGKNSFDVYRHGKYPSVDNSTKPATYLKTGGKVGYNILYCDGHVGFSNDRAESYRSLRMRFPS